MHPSKSIAPLTTAVLAVAVASLAACGSASSTTGSSVIASGSAASSGSTSAAAAPASAAPSVSAGSTGSTTAPVFPVTVKAANGSITLAMPPRRIVSMAPTATEMLYAIGAGAQVVAVDDNSNYPAGAPVTKLSAFQPNAEAVAAYHPDLVVLSNDANGFLASLTKLKIPTILLPPAATLDDAYQQETDLGAVTGHPDGATQVVTTTRSRIAAAVASVPASVKGRKVYHELDPTFYSATSSTFIGSIYTQFGLTDIADTAKGAAAAGGYPQLSAEYVVTQAPDLIVLADTKCCKANLASLAKRPAFGAIPAVKNDQVLAADDDIASRWGPRIADFAEALAKELQG